MQLISRIAWKLLFLSLVLGFVCPDALLAVPNDFNGDGKADIQWYNSSTGETVSLTCASVLQKAWPAFQLHFRERTEDSSPHFLIVRYQVAESPCRDGLQTEACGPEEEGSCDIFEFPTGSAPKKESSPRTCPAGQTAQLQTEH